MDKLKHPPVKKEEENKLNVAPGSRKTREEGQPETIEREADQNYREYDKDYEAEADIKREDSQT